MKKRFCVFLILMITIINGCAKEDVQDDKTAYEGAQYCKVSGSINEEGFLYINSDDGKMHFIDKHNADIILCNQPNCNHSSDDCSAALAYEAKTSVSMYKDNIYIYVLDDIFNHSVYVADSDGSNRRKLAELPFAYGSKWFVYYRDCVYYQAEERIREEEGGYVTYPKMIEINLQNGEYRTIVDAEYDKKYSFFAFWLNGDNMYYALQETVGDIADIKSATNYYDIVKSTVFKVDLISLEKTTYIEAGDYYSECPLGMYNGYMGLYDVKAGQNVKIREVETGKEIIVADASTGYIYNASMAGRYVQYYVFEGEVGDYSNAAVYLYDISTGEKHKYNPEKQGAIEMSDAVSGLTVFNHNGEYAVEKISFWED